MIGIIAGLRGQALASLGTAPGEDSAPAHRCLAGPESVAKWQPFLATVIRVDRHRLERNAKTGLWKPASEVSYYVANTALSVETAAGAIRGHWGIENRHQYPRDVAMGEDASWVRKNPGILARIRSFATNIMRANKVDNLSDARYRNALGGLEKLAQYHVM